MMGKGGMETLTFFHEYIKIVRDCGIEIVTPQISMCYV